MQVQACVREQSLAQWIAVFDGSLEQRAMVARSKDALGGGVVRWAALCTLLWSMRCLAEDWRLLVSSISSAG